MATMEKHFPFADTRKNNKKLPREFFKTAQYNTWMEFTYNPSQQEVLEYAHAVIDHGFEPGILIIDEGWHTRYGVWQFDFHKFPDPKAMIDELHSMGFTVMLWVTPLVTPDGQDFINTQLSHADGNGDTPLFLRTESGKIAIVQWWNGYSAILDLRKEGDRNYLDEKLQFLMKEYGVDGFKFDGGNYAMYHPDNIQNGKAAPEHDAAALNLAWNEFGARYRFHEYKDTFKGGGQWLYNLIPDFKVDEELFIRMAQASALFPIMQFSWAPWRVLSKKTASQSYVHLNIMIRIKAMKKYKTNLCLETIYWYVLSLPKEPWKRISFSPKVCGETRTEMFMKEDKPCVYPHL